MEHAATARAWGLPDATTADARAEVLARLPACLENAWNRYAVERSTDAFNDVAKLIELGVAAADA